MTRAQQAEQTKRAVLSTAQRLFLEHGYDATSLQMIADAMGVTKANVYYYFRTKAEMLAATLAPSVTSLRAVLDAAEAIRGKRERTRYLVGGFVNVLVDSRALAVSYSDPAVRRQKEAAGSMAELQERGMRVLFGDNPTADERLAGYLINSLGESVPLLSDLTDDELRDTLTRACARILRTSS
jgi:AcrR family transcriptional regulator